MESVDARELVTTLELNALLLANCHPAVLGGADWGAGEGRSKQEWSSISFGLRLHGLGALERSQTYVGQYFGLASRCGARPLGDLVNRSRTAHANIRGVKLADLTARGCRTGWCAVESHTPIIARSLPVPSWDQVSAPAVPSAAQWNEVTGLSAGTNR